MNVIVEQAIYEMNLLANNVPDGKHVVTGDIRKLSAKLYNSKAVVEYNIYGNSKQLNSLSLGINSKYAT